MDRSIEALAVSGFSGASYVVGVVIDRVDISTGTLITIISTVAVAVWFLSGLISKLSDRLTRIETKIDDLPCQGDNSRRHCHTSHETHDTFDVAGEPGE